jgi:hypothetical protein
MRNDTIDNFLHALLDRAFDATAFRHGVAATKAMCVAVPAWALPSTSCYAWPRSPRSSRGPRLPKSDGRPGQNSVSTPNPTP